MPDSDDIIDETGEHIALALKRANASIVPSPTQQQANKIVLGAESCSAAKPSAA
jgi:hypothetical protein